MLLEADNKTQPTSSEDDIAARLEPADFPHPPRTGTHQIPLTLANVSHLLRMVGVTARFNVIKKCVELVRRKGDFASTTQVVSLALLNGMSVGWLPAFIDDLALRNPHNPIKHWITSRPWDGTDRLQAMYDTVLQDADYPDDLKERLLYRWLLGVTAAGMKDGAVPLHGVLTLQGDQGVGKTSWI